MTRAGARLTQGRRDLSIFFSRLNFGHCYVLAALLGVAACGGGGGSNGPAPDPLRSLAPTGPMTLSPGNLAGQDEDPSLLVARDGSLLVAWYSNRNGLQPDGVDDKEIFVMRSADGASFTDPPIQATRHSTFAFYPSLAQDPSGAFHLAWWRLIPLPAGCNPGVPGACTGTANRILYKSSPDGVAWDLDQEEEIASGPGDWLPSLVADGAAGRLLVYFAAVARDANGNVNLAERLLRLHVVIRDAGVWSAPIPLAGVNEDTTHNTYPHVARRSDGSFLMTWTRYDAAAPNDVLQVIQEPSTDTMLSTSADGVAWSPPVRMSDGASAIDVFPSLVGDASRSQWSVTWITTAFGAPTVVELAEGASYPGDVVARPEIAGHSARIVPTATPGIHWAAWVEGGSVTPKVRHRFLAR